MKYKGLWELLLLIVLVCISVKVDLRYDYNKAKNYIGMNDIKDIVELNSDAVLLNNEDNSNESIIEYINNQSAPISIGISDINITCKGSGVNKTSDESLVKKNLKLDVYFSLTKNGERYDSIILKRKEKVYIHIVKEYTSNIYPTNDVQCAYNISC